MEDSLSTVSEPEQKNRKEGTTQKQRVTKLIKENKQTKKQKIKRDKNRRSHRPRGRQGCGRTHVETTSGPAVGPEARGTHCLPAEPCVKQGELPRLIPKGGPSPECNRETEEALF